jgi:cytochrome c-type biogenesis protein CcsB
MRLFLDGPGVMDQHTSERAIRPRRWSNTVLWGGWLLLVTVAVVASEYLESVRSFAGFQFAERFLFDQISYSNLLLIASTVLYVLHLWFTSEAVGRWASGLATTGALMALLALGADWVETYYLHRAGHVPLNSLYEMTALFSALTVAIYLVMERIYRTRAAGAFVMLIVFASVLFQSWLAANGEAFPERRIPALTTYWMHAHVLGTFIGYGAFAVAAAMGLAWLVRQRAEGNSRLFGLPMKSLPELHRIDGLMHRAILLGFPVFTVSAILGIFGAREAWGRYWDWDPKETWTLVVWLTYASYFLFRYVGHWRGRRMACWMIIGFGITVFCFLGVGALWPGLHSGAPLVR